MSSCVYVAITVSLGEASFFKIGKSNQIGRRIPAIQTGCPLKINRVLAIELPRFQGLTDLPGYVEKALHQRFKAYHSHGEWFQFTLSNKEHQGEFKQGCREVITPILGSWEWTEFDSKGLRIIRTSEQLAAAQASAAERERERAARVLRYVREDARALKGNIPGFWNEPNDLSQRPKIRFNER